MRLLLTISFLVMLYSGWGWIKDDIDSRNYQGAAQTDLIEESEQYRLVAAASGFIFMVLVVSVCKEGEIAAAFTAATIVNKINKK